MCLFRHKEIHNFLLHGYSERTDGLVHESSVDAHECLACLENLYLACTIRMHTLVVEKLATQEEVEAFEELCHLRVVDHAHVEQSVVGHGVGRLSIAGGVAYAHGHYAALDVVVVDFDVHAILQPLEYHEQEREEERQCARTKIVACLSAQVHYRGYESDVYAVEEIAPA